MYKQTLAAALRVLLSNSTVAMRLKAAGKAPKVIIVAAMRKLLHLIFGVLKSNTPFHLAIPHKKA